MMTLVFFLEELSAQAFLESFLPSILPSDFSVQYIVFEGKSDLEKRLAQRLRGWNKPNCKFIVLRDQDSADCKEVKSGLVAKCKEGSHPETLVRIACHELESWYLGDLLAVQIGLVENGLSKFQGKAKFRNPDELNNAADELVKLTKGKYQKVSGSREIGKYMTASTNRSHSFNMFYNGVLRLIETDINH